MGDQGDQGSGGVTPSASVSVPNNWSEADAVLTASGSRVVERPLERLVLRQVLGGCGQSARVSGSWAKIPGSERNPHVVAGRSRLPR